MVETLERFKEFDSTDHNVKKILPVVLLKKKEWKKEKEKTVPKGFPLLQITVIKKFQTKLWMNRKESYFWKFTYKIQNLHQK